MTNGKLKLLAEDTLKYAKPCRHFDASGRLLYINVGRLKRVPIRAMERRLDNVTTACDGKP